VVLTDPLVWHRKIGTTILSWLKPRREEKEQ